MPTIFEKNLTINAMATSVTVAARSFTLMRVNECKNGARCELCHQPIRKGALVRSDRTNRELTVGLDCFERLEFIQRSGRQPKRGELAVGIQQRKGWRSDVRRKPVLASAIAFFRRRRTGLPHEVRQAFEFLEVAGHPRTVKEGEILLKYYRKADPLWLLRLVRQKRLDWRERLGTIITLKVMGAEEFQQVRELQSGQSMLRVTVAGKYVHEWTYSHATGGITMKRYSRKWYAEHGKYRAWLAKSASNKPRQTEYKVITVSFEAGKPNPIAKNPSDQGPYVIPDFKIRQVVKIKIGATYRVVITRLSGSVRYCRVLPPAE